MHHIKQRKGLCLTQVMSADEDDKDDEYDRGILRDRDAQKLRCIKQRKGRWTHSGIECR